MNSTIKPLENGDFEAVSLEETGTFTKDVYLRLKEREKPIWYDEVFDFELLRQLSRGEES